MTAVTPRRFRYERGSAILIGLLGAGFLVAAGFFLWSALAAGPAAAPQVVLTVVTGAIGALLIAVGVHRRRQVIEVSSAGIRFGPVGGFIPWNLIRGVALEPFRGRIKLLDQAHRTVGVIPAGFDNEGVLLYTIASQAISSVDPIPERFEGAGGRRSWLFVLLPVWYIAKINFTRLAVAPLRVWIVVVGVLALLVWKIRDALGRTGAFEIRVDRNGIGYAGRGGEFDLRWPEVRTMQLLSSGQDGLTLAMDLFEGRPKRIPLSGVDLIPLLGAIRQHGGPLYGRMLLDPEAHPALAESDPASLSSPRS